MSGPQNRHLVQGSWAFRVRQRDSSDLRLVLQEWAMGASLWKQRLISARATYQGLCTMAQRNLRWSGHSPFTVCLLLSVPLPPEVCRLALKALHPNLDNLRLLWGYLSIPQRSQFFLLTLKSSISVCHCLAPHIFCSSLLHYVFFFSLNLSSLLSIWPFIDISSQSLWLFRNLGSSHLVAPILLLGYQGPLLDSPACSRQSWERKDGESCRKFGGARQEVAFILSVHVFRQQDWDPSRTNCKGGWEYVPAKCPQEIDVFCHILSFHSNPKERQCQRMFKLPHNCTHLTH